MKWGPGWSSAPGGWPEGSAWTDDAALGPLHARSAPGLSLMFPWGQDLGCGPDFITYQQMGESTQLLSISQSGNNSGKTFGSAGAVRGAALLASRSQQTSGTRQRTRTRTPEAQASYPSPGMEQVGELLAFCLRNFQCKFMGAPAGRTAVSFPVHHQEAEPPLLRTLQGHSCLRAAQQ